MTVLETRDAADPAMAPESTRGEPRGEGRRAGRLSIGRKTGYGAGQLVEMIVESMLNVFVLFYATAVCGLPGALAGLAIGAGIVVDAIVNPLLGSLSDGWRSRFGRRIPFMAVSLVPIVVTFNLIFALPSTMGQTALFLWLTLLSVLLRIALSVFTVPYQALGAELTDDYDERASVSAWRWGIGILGTLAVIGLGYGLFLSGPGGVSNRPAYLPFTLTLSVLLVLGASIAIRQGYKVRHARPLADAPTDGIIARLPSELAEIFRNRTFRILFAASLLFNIEVGVHQALALHVATYFWGLGPGQMQAVGMIAVFGLLLGAPLAGPLVKFVEKRTMLLIGMGGMLACHALPATLRLLGWLTLTGDALTAFVAAMSFLAGVMLALTVIAFLSIIPDAADEHEHRFGTQRQALYFAGWSFASKTATGAGVLVAGSILQLIDFPTKIAEHGGVVAVPERTAAWLAIAAGPAVALLSMGGIALIALFYKIDKQSHAAIITELTERRSASWRE